MTLVQQIEAAIQAGLSDPAANALVVQILQAIERAAQSATPNATADAVEGFVFGQAIAFVESFASVSPAS